MTPFHKSLPTRERIIRLMIKVIRTAARSTYEFFFSWEFSGFTKPSTPDLTAALTSADDIFY